MPRSAGGAGIGICAIRIAKPSAAHSVTSQHLPSGPRCAQKDPSAPTRAHIRSIPERELDELGAHAHAPCRRGPPALGQGTADLFLRTAKPAAADSYQFGHCSVSRFFLGSGRRCKTTCLATSLLRYMRA